jgi:hypothetical protein
VGQESVENVIVGDVIVGKCDIHGLGYKVYERIGLIVPHGLKQEKQSYPNRQYQHQPKNVEMHPVFIPHYACQVTREILPKRTE